MQNLNGWKRKNLVFARQIGIRETKNILTRILDFNKVIYSIPSLELEIMK